MKRIENEVVGVGFGLSHQLHENVPQIVSTSSSPSGHMSPYLSSQKQLLLPLLRSRSKKKKKAPTLRLWQSDAGLSA